MPENLREGVNIRWSGNEGKGKKKKKGQEREKIVLPAINCWSSSFLLLFSKRR